MVMYQNRGKGQGQQEDNRRRRIIVLTSTKLLLCWVELSNDLYIIAGVSVCLFVCLFVRYRRAQR